jgi:hypothetical protein
VGGARPVSLLLFSSSIGGHVLMDALLQPYIASRFSSFGRSAVENQIAEHTEHVPKMTASSFEAVIRSAQKNLACALDLTQ